jgi:cytochrome b561
MVMTEIGKLKYDSVAMLLHWVTALLIIFMLVFGEELIDAAEHGDGGTFPASVHVSVGVAILVLTLLRMFWRLTHAAPPLPVTMKSWETMLSKLTHFAFYALLIGIPLTGWLAFGDFVREEPAMAFLKVFGLFALPSAPDIGEAAKEIHEIGSNAMIVLVVLHVLAALKHQFVDDDGIFRRMLPH